MSRSLAALPSARPRAAARPLRPSDRTLLVISRHPRGDRAGRRGDDRLVGSPNGDTLSGAGGDDALIGGLGNDNLNGVDGHDQLFGNAGDDFLDGEEGDDEMVAAASADGADFIEGGSGTDTASYAFRGQSVTVSVDLPLPVRDRVRLVREGATLPSRLATR